MSHEENTSASTSRFQPAVSAVQRVDSGQLFFWGLMVVAAYMFVSAGRFSPEARLFPRLASGVILVAGVLRLAIAIFDINVQSSESMTLSGGNIGEEEAEEITNLGTMLLLGALIMGYVLGGYLVGLLWVTPLFVFLYMRLTGQEYWKSVVWTVALTGVAYGFMTIMQLDLMSGVLYG